jgi:hypothetical protein
MGFDNVAVDGITRHWRRLTVAAIGFSKRSHGQERTAAVRHLPQLLGIRYLLED